MKPSYFTWMLKAVVNYALPILYYSLRNIKNACSVYAINQHYCQMITCPVDVNEVLNQHCDWIYGLYVN